MLLSACFIMYMADQIWYTFNTPYATTLINLLSTYLLTASGATSRELPHVINGMHNRGIWQQCLACIDCELQAMIITQPHNSDWINCCITEIDRITQKGSMNKKLQSYRALDS